jgi:hypothetical protein
VTFFVHSPGHDERYQHLFAPEFDQEREARSFVDALWAQTSAFLDDDVQTAACSDFLPRFWEMYLAAGLLNGGLTLVPSKERKLKAGGPDILISEPRCFVEAIAVKPGIGADAVTKAEPLVVRSVPKREITLRLRQAIDEKHKKYQGYLAKGLLAPSDAYVIGIDGAAVPSTRGEPELPWIVCAVFPFGDSVFHLDKESREVTGHSYSPEHDLQKSSGAPVAKDIFLDASHAEISAIIYAWADEYSAAAIPGHDFIVVHNPYATNPISRGVLPCGLECWLEADELRMERLSSRTIVEPV